MWHDNETETDLLGFNQLVTMIVTLIQNDSLLPLTLGVFGDWGSGKSSLMRMAQKSFEDDEQYVCVRFSPWQHESYDDVKIALMTSVMTALQNKRSPLTKVEESVRLQAEHQVAKLLKRINWFRVASMATKGLGTFVAHAHGHSATMLAASAMADIEHLTQPGQLPTTEKEVQNATQGMLQEPDTATPEQEPELLEQSIDEFRQDFASLLDELPIKALIVFLDDLDRCLPPSIVHTFEAIRLFLAVPKTAFVIGADERIIRHAIGLRYPGLAGQDNTIGRDYLEKIVQIPLRIPTLNTSETETYLNLLGSQLHLDANSHATLVTIAAQNRQKMALSVAMNYGIAASHLPSVPQTLEIHMQLVSRIASILCRNFVGNPRQIKRFMNTLLLRRLLAQTQGITLDIAVLAKLMIVEYFHEPYFRQLFQWQADGSGVAAQIDQLEYAVVHTTEKIQNPPISESQQGWLNEPALKAWLLLEPSLARENLEPYFYFARERLSFANALTQRLSQQIQELLGKLRAESDTERQQGIKEAVLLSSNDLHTVYEVLLTQFQRDPHALNDELSSVLLKLAVQKQELIPAFTQALRASAPSSIRTSLPLLIKNTFGAKHPLPHELEDVLQEWCNQKVSPKLASAAKKALGRETP